MSQIIIPYRGLLGQQAAVIPPDGCVANQGLTIQAGSGNTNDDSSPLYGLYDYSETAHIYLQSYFGSGQKRIRRLEFYLQGYNTNYTYSDVEVWVGHVVQNEFPSGITVGYSALTITNLKMCWKGFWNAGQGAGWYYIDFENTAQGGQGIFCYNGTSNLIVIVKNKDGSWQSGYGYTQRTNFSGASTRYGMAKIFQDTTYPPNGTVMSRISALMNLRIAY